MEDLPPELVGQIYSQLSPRSIKRFKQTGKRYKEISEDPYVTKPVIVKSTDGKWITRTNILGCMNTLAYSNRKEVLERELVPRIPGFRTPIDVADLNLRNVSEDDLIPNMFVFEYAIHNAIVTSGSCPFDRNGFLNGTMEVFRDAGFYMYGRFGAAIDHFKVPIIKGLAHGKIQFLSTRWNDRNLEFNRGILTSIDYPKQLASESYDLIIRYDENFKIISNPYGPQQPLLPFQLPSYLTADDIVISVGDDIRDKVLPLGLFNCENVSAIEANVNYLINRLKFFIIDPIYFSQM